MPRPESLKRLLRDIVRFLRLRRSKSVPARPLRPYSSGGAAVALEPTRGS